MTAMPVPPTPSAVFPAPLAAATYAALPEGSETTRYELQEGMIVMAASPIPRHQRGLRRLARQLEDQLPVDLELLHEVDIDLELVPADQPGTVRVPDIVVISAQAYQRVDTEGGLLRASDVVLAIEIHSLGTRRTDTRIKYEEYADAGIDHYWMVDLADRPSLTACHRGGEFGYVDAGSVRGVFRTEHPFPVRIDLDRLG